MQRLEFISTLSLFQGLRYEELEALAQSAREKPMSRDNSWSRMRMNRVFCS